ncbi:MAG: glycosyltransferase [Candidatus Gottesmanbacteria bacterium]
MRVAIVYDRVNKWGGAERILLALHEIYPDAPLFTAVYNPTTTSWAKVFPQVITSFLQKFPFARNHHEWYSFLMPLAFESFNFNKYDLVISVTSEAAKGIITQPKTIHICYCLTPTRYLWQSYNDYFNNIFLRIISLPIINMLRKWDQIAAQRPDYFIAISQNVADRIKKYYQREATVIYPPANLGFSEGKKDTISYTLDPKPYFLVVSRLVPYKRIDIAINAFNELKLPLKIVGSGVEENKLRNLAKSNIEFLGQNLTDSELLSYYQKCRALIFPGEEDFGLVIVETQLCGRPVIAFKAGGALETVIPGKTGEFFYPQTVDALIAKVRNFNQNHYQSKDCYDNAKKYSPAIFREKFVDIIKEYIK